MNGYDRLLATIRGQAADRTPVAPQLFGHAARLCNVSLRDYGQSGALGTAEAQAGTLDTYA